MYCSSCGIEISDASRYCSQCGASTRSNGFTFAGSKPAVTLTRPRDGKKIAGVCAGIARFLGVDVVLVRIVMLLLAFWPPGVGLIVYVVCWIVMPQEPLLLTPPKQTTEPQSAPSAP